MQEFIEELKHNQKVNIEKGLENRINIDYVIERLEDIKKELLDNVYYFGYHNKNLTKKQDEIIENVIDCLENKGAFDKNNLNFKVKKVFGVEYTGGGIYLAYGQLYDGIYFTIGCDSIAFYDENEYNLGNDIDICDWEEEHMLKDIHKHFTNKQFRNILKQVYKKCKDEDKDDYDLFYLNNIGGK